MSKNYDRKGTIETQMKTSFVALVVLFAGVSSAFAQAKMGAAEAAGGAYYEFMMGMQLEMQGDGPGATAAYLRAERLDPTSAEIPAALAELYARLNRPADAPAAGERAVQAKPPHTPAHPSFCRPYAPL